MVQSGHQLALVPYDRQLNGRITAMRTRRLEVKKEERKETHKNLPSEFPHHVRLGQAGGPRR